jgi:hypothetical protein
LSTKLVGFPKFTKKEFYMGTGLAISGVTIAIICVSLVCTLVITVAAIAVPFIIIRKMNENNQKRAQELAAVGIRGEATILSVQDTGMRINDNPRIAMVLDVRLPNMPSYQIQKTITISIVQLAQVQVGAVVGVLVDPSAPNNPDKVGILLK